MPRNYDAADIEVLTGLDPVHGNSVANRDGVEFKGCAAYCYDTLCGSFGELLEVDVSGNECGVTVGDTDERLSYVAVG